MNRAAMLRRVVLPLPLALGLALAACHAAAPEAAQAPPLAGASIGGAFTLVDKDGRTVRWADFAGRYRIVYFGYTFCPDACPTDVARMMQGYARFAAAKPALAGKVAPLFITIDPARDTPKAVGEFAAAFSPALIGLTGTPAQVDQAARAFKVYYARGASSAGGYLMDHSRIAYLMGRDGAPIAMLPLDQGPDAVAAVLAMWVK